MEEKGGCISLLLHRFSFFIFSGGVCQEWLYLFNFFYFLVRGSGQKVLYFPRDFFYKLHFPRETAVFGMLTGKFYISLGNFFINRSFERETSVLGPGSPKVLYFPREFFYKLGIFRTDQS